MHERIHDDEPDTGEDIVRSLLRAECPQWSTAPLEYLRSSGTDNAMWRVRLDDEPDVVVRLPRRPAAAAQVRREADLLRQLEVTALGSLVTTPRVRHLGGPHDVFAHDWCVLAWIGGEDAWTARHDLAQRSPVERQAFAEELGRVVVAIGALDVCSDVAGIERRQAGSRGGPLGPLLERLRSWLDDPSWRAGTLIDVGAVRRLADEAETVVDEPITEQFVHGDLIPGNLLVKGGSLSAIIDWGGAGRGDGAQDLAPAWAVCSAEERSVFRSVVGADEAAWIRGRTFELEHAVGGVLYYVPKRHPLGDAMTRTLDQILADRDRSSG